MFMLPRIEARFFQHLVNGTRRNVCHKDQLYRFLRQVAHREVGHVHPVMGCKRWQ